MKSPTLSETQNETLYALAEQEEQDAFPTPPVRIPTLAKSLDLSEKECARIVRELSRLGLATLHDAGPGSSILNAASLTELGRKIAHERAPVDPKGRVSEFAEGLHPLQLSILDVVVEQESRIAGAAPTRTHVRTAVRNAAKKTTISRHDANAAIDGLLGTFLSVLGGGEPSYRVTLPGLLASKWGANALEIIDGMLRFLRDLQMQDPGLFRYSWTIVRRRLHLPRKAANLFYITVTQAGLGHGIFRSEGDDWWATPAELDVLLENETGLEYVRSVTAGTATPKASESQQTTRMPSDEVGRLLADLLERVARLEAGIGRANNPSVRVLAAFERLDLHPMIAAASSELFRAGYYRHAVLDAAIALNNYVKAKSGLKDADGAGLMTTAFSPNKPALVFNRRRTTSEKDEQQGLMYLFAGAMHALRNPRAHGLEQDQPDEALENIALFSFLARKLDRAKRTRRPRSL